MASQEWLPPRVSRLRNVAGAIGLATGCLIVLLLCAQRGAPALSADTALDAAGPRPVVWAETGDITPTWTSTLPVTTIVDDEPTVWSITQHGVTITFYRSAVVGSAWFTFTPLSSSPLTSSYMPTPYFFDLESEYMDSHKPVSLGKNGIQIELVYDESRLDGMDPRTLQFFHYGSTEWVKMGGDIDLVARTVTLQTDFTQWFGVGGQPPKQYVYLALVPRE